MEKIINFNSLEKNDSRSQKENTITLLEKEIASLKQELLDIEKKVQILESNIYSRYFTQILRIRELASIYKKQKSVKKEKRLEQKKRGKNYCEPTALVRKVNSSIDNVSPASSEELKKLYREAVIRVHPDKFAKDTEEISKRSQELTIQLIDIFQNGDIEQLRHFHSHIMSGNAIAYNPLQQNNLPDPEAMCTHLIREKNDLLASLIKAKDSRIYEVLSTYENPSLFIDELSDQFSYRIQQLEKRTRVKPIR